MLTVAEYFIKLINKMNIFVKKQKKRKVKMFDKLSGKLYNRSEDVQDNIPKFMNISHELSFKVTNTYETKAKAEANFAFNVFENLKNSFNIKIISILIEPEIEEALEKPFNLKNIYWIDAKLLTSLLLEVNRYSLTKKQQRCLARLVGEGKYFKRLEIILQNSEKAIVSRDIKIRGKSLIFSFFDESKIIDYIFCDIKSEETDITYMDTTTSTIIVKACFAAFVRRTKKVQHRLDKWAILLSTRIFGMSIKSRDL